jgi:thioredoxin-like negative regulator of GroEL
MSRLPTLLELHRQDPEDPDLLFMIASEHYQSGDHDEALRWLSAYVQRGRDVGAAYGLMSTCYSKRGDERSARQALQDGIDAALRCHHPSMAAQYRQLLEDFDEA